MDTQPPPAAFFDIGNTLASVRLSPRQPHRLERLDVYPQVPDVLQELRDNGVRLGIVSNIGQETEEDVRRVLEEAGLYDFFEPSLLVYGAKDSPEIFRRAAERADHSESPERCVYIGEDRDERGYALEAGFRVTPHPRLAREALNGSRLRYLRVTVPVGHRDSDGWREAILRLPVVPIHVTGENGTRVYAIATSSAASQLDDLGFEVLRLGGEDLPLTTGCISCATTGKRAPASWWRTGNRAASSTETRSPGWCWPPRREAFTSPCPQATLYCSTTSKRRSTVTP
jgi:leucyl aminopeptidase